MVVSIVFFAGVNLFMSHRLIDVPQLMEENMELFADIARAVFRRTWSAFIGIMIVTMWFNACLMFCLILLYYCNVKSIENPVIRFSVRGRGVRNGGAGGGAELMDHAARGTAERSDCETARHVPDQQTFGSDNCRVPAKKLQKFRAQHSTAPRIHKRQ